MLKRKLSTIIAAVVVINLTANPILAFAETMKSNSQLEESQEQKATVSKFSLYGKEGLDKYNEVYKVAPSSIKAITNNGGNYGSSTIDKAIDNNFSTHWETGKPNNGTFTNEVIVNFEEIESINRIVYAARQESAKGKGFAKELEIYASLTDDGDDFNLVCEGSYTGSTGDIVEIKFNKTDFKRMKFVFKNANQDWASASEYWFYSEDKVIDRMYNIFTDEAKNTVSSEFDTIEKLEAFQKEAITHPFYNEIKDDIENAKIILEGKDL
ncbi:MAG: discoidin domain-containing protein, partial [Clostridium sp.]